MKVDFINTRIRYLKGENIMDNLIIWIKGQIELPSGMSHEEFQEKFCEFLDANNFGFIGTTDIFDPDET